LSERVPKQHFYRFLTELLDWDVLYTQTQALYSHTGQPSLDLIVFFKRFMDLLPISSTCSTTVLAQLVRRIISQRKGVRLRHLRLNTALDHELGFDTVDVVDIILEIERCFQLTIPDEVPLHTVNDFVRYVQTYLPQQAA
jgi:acyl carrier protein